MASVKRKKMNTRRGRTEPVRPSVLQSEAEVLHSQPQRPPRKKTKRRPNPQTTRSADAGELRRCASESSGKTRAQQAAEERARRERRRARRKARRHKEVQPFKFREVRHKPVLYHRSDGQTAENIYKGAMTAAILLIVVFVVCAFFEVGRIQCAGSASYSGEEIVHYSGIETGDKMLFLRRQKAADRILEKLPYIRSVVVRKHFPTTVEVLVDERVPTAKIVDGGISYIIDDEGYLLEYTVAGNRFDLPEIICTAPTELVTGKQLVFADPLMLETLQNVLAYIVGSDWIENIDSINIERIYSISFSYQGRLEVKLGDTSDLEMKLKLLAEVIERNNEDATGTIDVSNTQRVSFQPTR